MESRRFTTLTGGYSYGRVLGGLRSKTRSCYFILMDVFTWVEGLTGAAQIRATHFLSYPSTIKVERTITDIRSNGVFWVHFCIHLQQQQRRTFTGHSIFILLTQSRYAMHQINKCSTKTLGSMRTTCNATKHPSCMCPRLFHKLVLVLCPDYIRCMPQNSSAMSLF